MPQLLWRGNRRTGILRRLGRRTRSSQSEDWQSGGLGIYKTWFWSISVQQVLPGGWSRVGTRFDRASKLMNRRRGGVATLLSKAAKQSKVLTAALKRCATSKPQSDGVFPQPA